MNMTYIQCISEFECDGIFIHKFIDFFQISYEITLRPSNQSKHQHKCFLLLPIHRECLTESTISFISHTEE